jgi:hypothetical protein
VSGGALYDGRVRLLAASLVLGLLGLGGAALAQPLLVEDPWANPRAQGESWFSSSDEQARPALPVEAVLYDPWAKSDAPKPEPVSHPIVEAQKRPEPVQAQRSVASFDEESLVVDPWAPARNVASTPVRTADRRGAWSSRMVEIVDPWNRAPERATNGDVRLVVDPWAR